MDLREKYKEIFNLFALLTRPVSKTEREEWKQAMHVFRHRKEDHDYREVRKKFLYPQLLRVLLKAKKAENLREAFDRAVTTKGDISWLKFHGRLESVATKLTLYGSFALPAFLAEKADQTDEFIEVHDHDHGHEEHLAPTRGHFNSVACEQIWKNLGREIVRALNSTCTVEQLAPYWKKYGVKKVNLLIETLIKIAEKFAGIENSTQLIKKFQSGEAKPESYSEKKLRKYKVKELEITWREQQKRAQERKLKALGISRIYWEDQRLLDPTPLGWISGYNNDQVDCRRKWIEYLDGRFEETNEVEIDQCRIYRKEELIRVVKEKGLKVVNEVKFHDCVNFTKERI